MPDEWLDRDLVDRHRPPSARRVRPRPATPRATTSSPTSEASLLFAGDHVLSTITPSIGFEPAYVQQPLRDYLASLAKVRALPDLKLLPGARPGDRRPRTPASTSWSPTTTYGSTQSLEAVEVGRADGVGGRRRAPVDPSRAPPRRARSFDAVLAAFETLAHLELLALQGKVARVDRVDGPVRAARSGLTAGLVSTGAASACGRTIGHHRPARRRRRCPLPPCPSSPATRST